MIKKVLAFFCISCFPLSNMAQSSQKSIDEELKIRNEISGGYMLHPRGMGINLKQGRRLNENNWRVISFDLLSMKHPKEFRVRSTGFSSPGSYIFGKLNSAFFVRGGIGIKKNLSGKLYRNTISASVQIEGGPVLGLLKPVYLEIYHSAPDLQNGYLLSERYNPDVHTDQSVIFGNSRFGKGLGDTKARAGAYVKAGLQLDWSDFPDHLQSIELGISVDMFPQHLPIMAYAANKNVYGSLYICINLGNRW
jgi:hypothetical protein